MAMAAERLVDMECSDINKMRVKSSLLIKEFLITRIGLEGKMKEVFEEGWCMGAIVGKPISHFQINKRSYVLVRSVVVLPTKSNIFVKITKNTYLSLKNHKNGQIFHF